MCVCLQARGMALMATLRYLLQHTAPLPMLDAAAAHKDCTAPLLLCVLSPGQYVSILWVYPEPFCAQTSAGQAMHQC